MPPSLPSPGFAEDRCGGGGAALLTLCFAEEPRVLVSINKPRDGMQEVPKLSFPLRGNPEVSWFLRRLLTDKHNARIHVCFRHPALAAQTRNYSKSYYASSYISKLRHTVAHMLEMVHMRPVFFLCVCVFFPCRVSSSCSLSPPAIKIGVILVRFWV